MPLNYFIAVEGCEAEQKVKQAAFLFTKIIKKKAVKTSKESSGSSILHSSIIDLSNFAVNFLQDFENSISSWKMWKSSHPI